MIKRLEQVIPAVPAVPARTLEYFKCDVCGEAWKTEAEVGGHAHPDPLPECEGAYYVKRSDVTSTYVRPHPFHHGWGWVTPGNKTFGKLKIWFEGEGWYEYRESDPDYDRQTEYYLRSVDKLIAENVEEIKDLARDLKRLRRISRSMK